MQVPLFENSRIPSPPTYQERVQALISEHIFLRQIFVDLENDKDAKVNDPLTRSLCAFACAIPDLHNEEVVSKWGEAPVLAGACAAMLKAAQRLVHDDSAKFGDNTIWPRLLEAVRTTEVRPLPEDAYFSPV